MNNNLPTVAVHEVAQPTTASEIVIATHGRSIWVLDVASLRQMSAIASKDPLKDPATLFAPAHAIRWNLQAGGGVFPYSLNMRKFYGTNPDRRVSLDYMLTKPAKDLSLKIVDATGKSSAISATPRRNRAYIAPRGISLAPHPLERVVVVGRWRWFWWGRFRSFGSGGNLPRGPDSRWEGIPASSYGRERPNSDPKALITLEVPIRGDDDDDDDGN